MPAEVLERFTPTLARYFFLAFTAPLPDGTNEVVLGTTHRHAHERILQRSPAALQGRRQATVPPLLLCNKTLVTVYVSP